MQQYLNEQTDVLKYVFLFLLKCRARLSRTESSNSLGTCTTSPFPSCPSFVALWFASKLHASGKCQISAQQTFLYSRYPLLTNLLTGWVCFVLGQGTFVKARIWGWKFVHLVHTYWESMQSVNYARCLLIKQELNKTTTLNAYFIRRAKHVK